MKKLFIIILLLVGMNSCNHKEYQPQNCDLIFQLAESTKFSKAITDATAHHDDMKFDHVGMVFMEGGVAKVVEASAKHGVTIVTLEQFIEHSPAGYVVKRVTSHFTASTIIKNALSHLGEPYDWSYRPNNGKMYCSELIYESFTDKTGKHIFQANPMNFRNAKGEMPEFWIDLFKKLGEEIPEGVMGTNPNDLAKEKSLKEIYCMKIN